MDDMLERQRKLPTCWNFLSRYPSGSLSANRLSL